MRSGGSSGLAQGDQKEQDEDREERGQVARLDVGPEEGEKEEREEQAEGQIKPGRLGPVVRRRLAAPQPTTPR